MRHSHKCSGDCGAGEPIDWLLWNAKFWAAKQALKELDPNMPFSQVYQMASKLLKPIESAIKDGS